MLIIEPTKLPSASTIDNWSVERGLLARKQIAETDYVNTTLHTDEASKYGNKWGAFATRNDEGDYLVLGLRDMATKSSQDTLDTFKGHVKILFFSQHCSHRQCTCNITDTNCVCKYIQVVKTCLNKYLA